MQNTTQRLRFTCTYPQRFNNSNFPKNLNPRKITEREGLCFTCLSREERGGRAEGEVAGEWEWDRVEVSESEVAGEWEWGSQNLSHILFLFCDCEGGVSLFNSCTTTLLNLFFFYFDFFKQIFYWNNLLKNTILLTLSFNIFKYYTDLITYNKLLNKLLNII
jgi:hypothetical protein